MSYIEVCHEIESWPSEQRQDLARHLKILELINDPTSATEIGRRIDEMEAGHGVTREELVAHLEKRGISWQ